MRVIRTACALFSQLKNINASSFKRVCVGVFAFIRGWHENINSLGDKRLRLYFNAWLGRDAIGYVLWRVDTMTIQTAYIKTNDLYFRVYYTREQGEEGEVYIDIQSIHLENTGDLYDVLSEHVKTSIQDQLHYLD